jgi:ABC-type sugar transport system permease subunit
MSRRRKKITPVRGGLVLIFLLLALYLFPFASSLDSPLAVFRSLREGQDGLLTALVRSSLFALITSLLLVLLGIVFSLLLMGVPFSAPRSRWLSLLLMPLILGSVSSAFIWKILLFDNAYLFGSATKKFLAIGFMEFWQFGTFFSYLFWLNLQTIRTDVLDYAAATRLGTWEKVKDIFLPHQRNLALLLYVICFIFCFYEESKIELIFRGSRGTNTELINHWLNRTYQSDSLLSPEFAFRHVSTSGLLVLLVALGVLVVTLIVKNSLYKAVTVSKRLALPGKPALPGNPALKNNYSWLVLWLLVIVAVAPVPGVLLKQSGNLHFSPGPLGFPLLLTLLAAMVSSAFAICFGILSRLAWQRSLAGFNYRSMIFLILLFTLLIIPPIVILISGFRWMRLVGYASEYNIDLAWLFGHTILSFPLLAGFSVATHFRVKIMFIDYLDAHSLTLWEKIVHLFLLPFRADYLLTLIIAFSIIWNESIINNILSDFIPSFITELNKTITGKAVDYSQGMNYLFVSLVLAIGSVSIWNYIISKSQTNP